MSNVDISVLPTLVLVRAHDGVTPTIDLAGADVGNALRLDQVGALYDIVDLARLGRISARDGLARLAEVWVMPARFGPAVRIFGHVVLSVGLGLILTPRPTALLYCAGLGLLVGVLIEPRPSLVDARSLAARDRLAAGSSARLCRHERRPGCRAAAAAHSTADYLPARWHADDGHGRASRPTPDGRRLPPGGRRDPGNDARLRHHRRPGAGRPAGSSWPMHSVRTTCLAGGRHGWGRSCSWSACISTLSVRAAHFSGCA